jgi:hypothetical protein
MSKKLDVNKVDAALQRAAQAAISGGRDERAGRFTVREADSGRFVRKNKQPSPPKKG